MRVLSCVAAAAVPLLAYKLFRQLYKSSHNYNLYFKDKVVWITGASSGIGEGLAYALSAFGCKLIISARREVELLRVKDGCRGPVFVLPLDLASLDTLEDKAQLALAEYGHIDVLINNGGLSTRSWGLETCLQVDKYVMDVNYFSATILSKAVLPSMIRNRSGHLCTISSMAGKLGVPLRTAYCASKHALHGFFDALRSEISGHNISVSLICPGYVKTNISVNAMVGDGTRFGKVDANIAAGLEVDCAVQQIVAALYEKREEIILGGPYDQFLVYLKTLCPSALSRILRGWADKQLQALQKAK
eukprot:GILK01011721.1.p1 GENE.GILK01011721.1~~GILK01011721.1.p1  ORF type:complete len:303 (+),score=22.47 GILK01011721.1:67-975(+)